MAAFETACQHRRLVRGGLLLAGKHLSSGAIHRIDRNHVRRPQAGDGSREVGFHTQPLAELLRQLGRNLLLASLSQILQIVVQFRIAHQLQQRRLLELNGQRFFQGGIENRVAGLIGEVGKDELIFVGQLHGLMLAPVKTCRQWPAPEVPLRSPPPRAISLSARRRSRQPLLPDDRRPHDSGRTAGSLH